MSQSLALLICASPANREYPSVYVSSGKWVPDVSEIVDSKLQIYIEEPIFSDNWIPYLLIEEQYVVGPGNFRVEFTHKGTEKFITLLLNKVEE